MAGRWYIAATSGDRCSKFETESHLQPILVINPRTDASFVTFVREHVADHPDDDPPALERRLKERHPAAMVRARVLANEPWTVWYVYRDGHWTLPETGKAVEVRVGDGAP